MANIYFISYADEKYAEIQKKRTAEFAEKKYFDTQFMFTRDWLVKEPFYEEHKEILDAPRGGGFCCWKPYILLETIKTVEPGDIILYLDVSDEIKGDKDEFRKLLTDLTNEHDIVLTSGKYKNKQYTKNHVFEAMNATGPEFREAIQLECGIILLKASLNTYDLMTEYLYWCTQKDVIDDTLGAECPDFIDVRYDQSVLSIMAIQHDLFQTDTLRKYITCNVNQVE